MQTSVRSAGPRPCKVSHASRTSNAFPMAQPKGRSISVMSATVRRPTCSPMDTISFASAMESSRVFIKAPLPVLTSRRIRSEPAAIFLLIMLEAISGMLLTVAVTSRSA